MVADTGLQPDVDEVEDDAGVATDDSTESGAEVAPQDEVDPLADLRAQVGAAATRADLERLQNQIRSELGRSQRLETRLEALVGANPLADVDPRLDANENLLTSIAEALIDSDLTDDTAKRALRASRAALDSARTTRAQGRMREELKREILGALPQPRPEEAAPDGGQKFSPESIAAASEARGYARAKGVSPDSIPATAWSLLAGETLDQAVARVESIVDDIAAGASAATRIATRRQAAGAGAPARSGGAINDEDIIARYAAGDRAVTNEQYVAANRRLGLD